MSNLRIRLCDAKRKSWDCRVQLDKAGWRFVDFRLDNARIDLSRIKCIIFSLNDIMCGNRPASVELGGLLKVRKCNVLDTPSLSINGQEITFPCKMHNGDVLQCRDQRKWQLQDAFGNIVAEGKVKGAFPALNPGLNAAELHFRKTSSAEFRAIVNIIKKY